MTADGPTVADLLDSIMLGASELRGARLAHAQVTSDDPTYLELREVDAVLWALVDDVKGQA